MRWDNYFMGLARGVALKSKDPSTKHGALIVDPDRVIESTGYNGPPAAIDDLKADWERPGKYAWIIHAEENALWYAAHRDLSGCTLYVTGFPCSGCVLRMVRARLSRCVYGDVDWSQRAYDEPLARRIAELGGLILEEHTQ